MSEEHIVVIGGGLVGVTTAFMLKWRNPGKQVTLIEKGRIGSYCSYQNAGVFSFVGLSSYNPNQLFWKFLRGMYQPDSFIQIPFQTIINPGFLLFISRTLFATLFANSKPDRHLGYRSQVIHEQVKSEFKEKYPEIFQNYESHDKGVLEILETQAEIDMWEKYKDSFNKDYNQQVQIHKSAKTCQQLEPTLSHMKAEIMACRTNYAAQQAGYDSNLFAQAFAQLSQKLGARIIENAEVTHFHREGNRVKSIQLSDGQVIEADKFIISAGIHSKQLGKKLGWTLPMWAGKGYSANVDWGHKSEHAIHFGTPYTWLVETPKGLRVSYFLEFTTPDRNQVEPEKLAILERNIRDRLGDVAIRDPWVGFRPIVVDQTPIIGRFPYFSNVYLNTGQGSRGLILSLGSAELTEELINSKPTTIDANPYNPNRFYI